MSLASGADIPIEFRDAGELLCFGGRPSAAAGAGAWNPVFDLTPGELVDALVTEKGIVHAPNAQKLTSLMGC
jgi:methylthioribose-1-phosphate isomerase